MKKFSELHLKSQVRLLLVLTVAAIMIFGASYYAAIADALKSKEVRMVNNAHAQISAGVERINGISQAYGDYLAQNTYVRGLIKADKDAVRYGYNQTLYNILPVITSYNASIDSVVFLSNDGHAVPFNRSRFNIIERVAEDYGIFNTKVTNHQFTGVYNDQDGIGYYCYVKTVFDSGLGTKPEEKIGTCVIIVSANGLRSTLPVYSEEQNTYYAVVDGSGSIVISNHGELDAGAAEKIAAGTDGDEGGNLTLVTDAGAWKLVSITPGENIYTGIRRLLVLGILFLVFIGAGFMILLFQIQRTIIKPIEKIVEYTGTEKRSLRVNGTGELKEILYYMNNLSKEIKYVAHSLLDAQSRIYEIEISKHKAEYSALQSQINPHFLYNTLDCIKGHAILGGNEEIVTITSSLSAIMRYCIKGADLVPVREEITCIRQYISIIEVRFEGRFHIHTDVSEEILDLQMPRFLLQPILENAVYHGLEPKYGGGEARITGELRDGAILFEVYDNGCGIKRDKLEEINGKLADCLLRTDESKKEIGLININRRIKILFGDAYGIAIESEPERFTSVKVTLPTHINRLDIFIE